MKEYIHLSHWGDDLEIRRFELELDWNLTKKAFNILNNNDFLNYLKREKLDLEYITSNYNVVIKEFKQETLDGNILNEYFIILYPKRKRGMKDSEVIDEFKKVSSTLKDYLKKFNDLHSKYVNNVIIREEEDKIERETGAVVFID